LNPRTWVPKASMLTPRPPKPVDICYFNMLNYQQALLMDKPIVNTSHLVYDTL
jgi:hypothetical protein